MPATVSTYVIYAGAALAEIAGCFAFWHWLRNGQSMLWIIPGLAALAVFAWLLTLSPASHSGRAFAAYGGIYIAASLCWFWLVEHQKPDVWDLMGGALAVVAAGIILFAPRAA